MPFCGMGRETTKIIHSNQFPILWEDVSSPFSLLIDPVLNHLDPTPTRFLLHHRWRTRHLLLRQHDRPFLITWVIALPVSSSEVKPAASCGKAAGTASSVPGIKAPFVSPGALAEHSGVVCSPCNVSRDGECLKGTANIDTQ
jgi:hypothetical protein